MGYTGAEQNSCPAAHLQKLNHPGLESESKTTKMHQVIFGEIHVSAFECPDLNLHKIVLYLHTQRIDNRTNDVKEMTHSAWMSSQN